MYKSHALYTVLLITVVRLDCFISVGQVPSPHWQKETVTAVETHLYRQGERASHTVQYDVSVRVGDTIYEVLYAPPPRSTFVGYSPSTELLVSVGRETVTVNSRSSGMVEAPILHRRAVKDLSKVPKSN